jgi:hypothetical protein
MLSQGGCCSLEDVDDAQDFAAVAEALQTLDLRYIIETTLALFRITFWSMVLARLEWKAWVSDRRYT